MGGGGRGVHHCTYHQLTIQTPTPDAFIRDELSKGRYDPPVADITFEMMMELFGRTVRSDLGPPEGGEVSVEDVC